MKMVRIAIIDYGMGNLQSIQRGLERVGARPFLTSDNAELDAADGIVLPGVGAFGDAMKNLKASGLVEKMKEQVDAGKLFLGICLGLQLLFEESTEGGLHGGLGILPGRVVRFPEDLPFKVPHVGWNSLVYKKPEHFILEGIPEGSYVYFVHSYHAMADEGGVVATADYGGEFPAIVQNGPGNLVATQFHPEKSSALGLKMLGNFLARCKR